MHIVLNAQIDCTCKGCCNDCEVTTVQFNDNQICNPNPWILEFEDNFNNNQLDLIRNNNSQNIKKPPSYEINFNLNKAILSQKGIKNQYGFGISLLYLLYSKQHFEFLSGMEYNNINFIKDKIFIDRFSSYNDVALKSHSLSLPINLRFNISRSSKVFIETGFFITSIFKGQSKGEIVTYNNLTQQYYSYYNKDSFESDLYHGGKFGIGINLLIKNIKFIMKVEYKYSFSGVNIYDDFFRINTLRLILGIRFN
ncbi:MAG: PorT family protein [Vicingaceae bacterium]|nr:PorT family protein [Vicingaceae bacterium]